MKNKGGNIRTGLICTLSGVALFFVLYRFEDLAGLVASFILIIRPVLIGLFIAIVLRWPCSLLQSLIEKHFRLKHPFLAVFFSVFICYLLMGGLIALVFIALGQPLWSSLMQLAETFTDKLGVVLDGMRSFFAEGTAISNVMESVALKVEDYIGDLSVDTIQPYLSNIGSGIVFGVNLTKDIIIGFIISVYLVGGRRGLKQQVKRVLMAICGKHFRPVADELKFADRAFSGFILGKIIDSIIIGVLCFILCKIFSMPNTPTVAFIIGLTNVIPVFGPIIGAIPTTIIILAEDPVKALVFLIIVICLQTFDGYILGPRILGNCINLSGFWILVAVLLGAGMFGVIGMFIGVPAFAVFYDIVSKLVELRLKKQAEGKEAA